MMTEKAHRPHCSYHNYHDRGIYLITLVVSGREPILGKLNMDAQHPDVELTEIGKAIATEWENTENIQAQKGNKVRIIGKCVMPDHFHGLIFVEEPMKDSIGLIIRGFKQACNKALREWYGYRETERICQVHRQNTNYEARLNEEEREKRTREIQELAYRKGVRDYRLASGALFDADYDDSILWHKGQLQAMIDYIKDNPRRAILRKLYPDFHQRCLHIWIEGEDEQGRPIQREYAAFGNLFLLRHPWKEPIMCHRWKMNGMSRDYNMPYVGTEEYSKQHDEMMKAAQEGAVLVTPGISEGERKIKNECIEQGLPLIHLQKEPIGAHWKPEKARFEACRNGQLLILAPWNIDKIKNYDRYIGKGNAVQVAADTDYSQFHNMNDLAKEICRGVREARIVKM